MNKFTDEVNALIIETCARLKLPNITRASSQIIFQHVYPVLSKEYSTNRIIYSIIFLAAKMTESSVKPAKYQSTTGFAVDTGLELQISDLINYEFGLFDVHGHVKEICKVLHLKADEKIEIIDRIYASDMIKKVGFIGDGYDVHTFCLCPFSDDEVDLFEKVFCVEVDKEILKNIRKELFSG